MATTIKVKCKRCKVEFDARLADRKRGWAKFCSKSCKAVNQTKRLGRPHNTRIFSESDHEKAMYDSTASHGQDGMSGV